MIRELVKSIIDGKEYNEKFVEVFGKILKEKINNIKCEISLDEGYYDRNRAFSSNRRTQGGRDEYIQKSKLNPTKTGLAVGNPTHDSIAKMHGYTPGDTSKGQDTSHYYGVSDLHAKRWKLNSSFEPEGEILSEDGFKYITVRLPNGKVVLRKRRIYSEDSESFEDEFLLEVDDDLDEAIKFNHISVSREDDKKHTIYGHKIDGSKQKIMSVSGKNDQSKTETAKAAHTMAKSVAKRYGITKISGEK